jgi:predicted short-subunit dehydrogenase-like oxidoreductase (DUF2520 family)
MADGRRERPTGGVNGGRARGDADTIATRLGEYRRAGADHIMLHMLNEDAQPGPVEVARQLAGRLLAGRPSAAS